MTLIKIDGLEYWLSAGSLQKICAVKYILYYVKCFAPLDEVEG